MRIKFNTNNIDVVQLFYDTYQQPDFDISVYNYRDRGEQIHEVVVFDRRDAKSKKHEFKLNTYSNKIAAYSCPHCGSEIYGEWPEHTITDVVIFGPVMTVDTKYHNIVETEMEEMRNLDCCPVCSGKLSHDEGFYLEKNFSSDDMDHHFKMLSYERRNAANQASEDRVKSNLELWSESLLPAAANAAAEIRNDTAKLNEYLHYLIKLEMNVYSLSRRLKALYPQQMSFQRLVRYAQYAPLYESKQKAAELQSSIAECRQKIKGIEAGNADIKIDCTLPTKPTEPVYATPGLLNKKKVLAENEALKAKYEAELRQYEEQLAAYEKAKEQEKSRLILEAENEIMNYENELAKLQQAASDDEAAGISEGKAMIDKEIADAELLLKETCSCRSQFYGYDIVFPKYRNAVALSTFYEYLSAGRCTQLEGADGAYNIYENEIRADRIIGQLTQVIERIDDIKDGQYMIYSELQSVNKNLDRLNKTMDTALDSIQNMEKGIQHIADNTDVIAHNTAVTAYYSKMNAELTNALGYMVAFK